MESTFIIWSQVITFGTAWSMFHCIFKRKKRNWISLAGALVYLLLPYHVYTVIQSGDRPQTLIWMLVPILTASLVKMSDTEKMFWKTGYGLTAVLSLGNRDTVSAVCSVRIFIGTETPEWEFCYWEFCCFYSIRAL